MITLYQGGLGSGKTYDSVRRIIDNIRLGRRILTNIDGFNNPINNEVIKHHFEISDYDFKKNIVYLSDDDVLHFWDFLIPNDFIVIDETQDYFGSRNWSSKENNKFLSWATSHRHDGQDLLLISPKIAMIDKQVRSMAEWIYSYRKVNMFGSLVNNKYVRFAFYEGDETPISKKTLSYDPLVFKCYQSYFSDESKEIKIESGTNILKHPIFFAIPIVIGFLIYFLLNSSLLGGGVKNNAILETAKVNAAESCMIPVDDTTTGEGRKVDHPPESSNDELIVIGVINGQRMIKTDKGVIIEKN